MQSDWFVLMQVQLMESVEWKYEQGQPALKSLYDFDLEK